MQNIVALRSRQDIDSKIQLLTASVERLTKTVFQLEQKLYEAQVEKTISISTSDGFEIIKVDRIIRCEADGNYCHIHISGENSLYISKTLKFLENELSGAAFIRIHQSHLVNKRFIRRYSKGSNAHMELQNGDVLPISRRRVIF
jgi:two-component system LytT family response regulator